MKKNYLLQLTLAAMGGASGRRYGLWKKKEEEEGKKTQILNQAQGENLTHRSLMEAAAAEEEAFFELLHADPRGLTEEQAQESREAYGNNKVVYEKRKSLAQELVAAFINPFTVILLFLAGISAVTDIVLPLYKHVNDTVDPTTVIIILTMVLISGVLRFVQERRSGDAGAKLLEMITTTCSVKRYGENFREIPLEEVVVGDLVHLAAGDMIPADLRLLEAKDLFVSQAALNGESDPMEKNPEKREFPLDTMTEYANLAFMGSSVISGSATGMVIAVGNNTLFGSMAQAVAEEASETSFTKGVNSVSWVLIRFMMIMVPLVFFVNGFTKGHWVRAFLFAVSIAVGLTPEMLPMIVTTCLAKGAVSMSKKKTVVKNLNSIQNFGAMDILCTDKTGTLTQDKVVLQYHMDVHGNEDNRILRHGYLNSYFQTGYRNLMDLAIIHKTEEQEREDSTLTDLSEVYVKVDEIPFDFTRRRLSVVVEDKTGKTQMITKGAVEEMLSVCSHAEYQGKVEVLTQELRKTILATAEELNDDGMRVIALAQKTNPSPAGAFSVEDEKDMVLLGYLAFLDPPKESTKEAIEALREHGVTTKILTGDNERITRCICKQVGLDVQHMMLGGEVDRLSDEKLAVLAERVTVFAKLSPEQKARVVTLLRENGHSVGYMGDGINDAAAMKASDIGISVDTAVDIAKESADIILLEKDLMVLEEGILEGRKTYANMIKYIKMTASSNFGNAFSVLLASLLLPFLPMESVHLIFLNLVYDLSCAAIPWDNVDPEFLKIPRTWEASSVGNFMLWFGPVSSIFDWTTYAVLYFFICPALVSSGALYHAIDPSAVVQGGLLAGMNCKLAYAALFQTGWFVESMWSQTMVIHMIRTPKIPFLQSRASGSLTLFTTAGIVLLTAVPFTPLGRFLGLTPLPGIYFAFLAVTILAYMALATAVKKLYVRKFGDLL